MGTPGIMHVRLEYFDNVKTQSDDRIFLLAKLNLSKIPT